MSPVGLSARNALLGHSPDYHYLSYRLSQIYSLVFCGKYSEHLTVFDSRLTTPTHWTYLVPQYRDKHIGGELGRFNGRTNVDDAAGVALFSVRLQLDAVSYRVVESSKPLPSTTTLFGTSLPKETWWVDKVPSSIATAELLVSQINRPTKSLYSVYLEFQGLSHDFEILLSQLPAARRDQLVTLLNPLRPWYDKLTGWLILLAEATKQ